MPLYEFYCPACQKKHEELCSSAVSSMNCPLCGGKTDRTISTFRTGPSSKGGGTTSSACGG